MISTRGGGGVGDVTVAIKNYGGASAEEITDDAMRAILSVEGEPPEIVKQQLIAFQGRLRVVLLKYFKIAQEQERFNIYGQLMKQGSSDLAKIIGNM